MGIEFEELAESVRLQRACIIVCITCMQGMALILSTLVFAAGTTMSQ